jgi:serine/threonine-protein kinase
MLTSPAVANGIVYVGSEDHNVYALDAKIGGVVWSFLTGDMVHFSPAVAKGVVYIGSNDRNVYALDAATGAKVWNYTTRETLCGHPPPSPTALSTLGVAIITSTPSMR